MSPPIDRRDFVRLSSVAALAAPTLLALAVMSLRRPPRRFAVPPSRT